MTHLPQEIIDNILSYLHPVVEPTHPEIIADKWKISGGYCEQKQEDVKRDMIAVRKWLELQLPIKPVNILCEISKKDFNRPRKHAIRYELGEFSIIQLYREFTSKGKYYVYSKFTSSRKEVMDFHNYGGIKYELTENHLAFDMILYYCRSVYNRNLDKKLEETKYVCGGGTNLEDTVSYPSILVLLNKYS